MGKRSTVTPPRAKTMKEPKKVTVHNAVPVTGIRNANTVSNPVDESIGGDKASAKVHSQANPSSSHEKSSSADFAEENNGFSNLYFNMSSQAPRCNICTDQSSVCVYCSADGQDYDAWSDNTGGHGFTTDMNKPGDKIQLQIWSYETSHVTVAERLEQRKWCGPGQKL
ncbi:hypothetical protein NHQ30_011000 [Ciborinia camelliae]|nr:hypothetical protein NHQ30_011000 [Ciborinia camelliae]